MTRIAITILLFCLLVGAGQAQRRPATDLGPTVILISFDGWRWDYESRYSAPNLRRLAARGVRAEGLIPSFPSKTFPNHYSIVTGLYPGHHGIVANNIRDPGTGRRFAMSDRKEVQDPMWWGGEPIWVTAQRAGQSAAAMFWPGSEAPVGGMWPRYWLPFDDTVPGTRRVDRVLGWLDLAPESRPTLLTLYFSDVDTAGHLFGPDSAETREAVRRVDGYLGRLTSGLERRGLLDRVNLIAVSDHGMAATSDADRVVVLDDYISLTDVELVDLNPTIGLIPKPGRDDAVFTALASAHPRMKVYRRADTPAHWHYRDHPRIPPIVGVAEEGWQVLRRSTLNDRRTGKARGSRGEHGYDPAVSPSMRGLFVAAGPAFTPRTTVPAFENVNVYDALARILGVPPAPNDGNPAVTASFMR